MVAGRGEADDAASERVAEGDAASLTIVRAGATDRRPPFKFSAFTRVGFSDTDAQGIVYYGRYLPYFDLARVEYSRFLGLLGAGGVEGQFVMRACTIEYLAPARFDDALEVFVRHVRLGRTSASWECAAYRRDDDVLMVTARQTLVFVDRIERRARPIPASYRETALAFEGDDCESVGFPE